MYYVKKEITGGAEDLLVMIDITDENTYTQCATCGKEIQIDLNDAVVDGQLDLFGTSWFCEECTRLRRNSAKAE